MQAAGCARKEDLRARRDRYADAGFRRGLDETELDHTGQVTCISTSITVAFLLLSARAEQPPGELYARVTMR
jgi:hypothetical protein